MKRKLMLLMTCLFLGIGLTTAQVKTVTGTVTSSEDGLPIVGANILVKGTSIGTVTDLDGNFTLTNLPSTAKTLTVSYIGMQTQELPIKAKMNIVMNLDAKVLDEVMVVAFGTAKKSAFTGSAAVMDSKKISQHITTNVANALVGTVPGLQMRGTSGAPGAGAGSMNIRGIASMYSSTDPLIIVDGAPYSASLSNIPQGDIESVTVLKDAASAALYGSRGAAGVILVTTKKGKSQEAQVTLDMKWGSNSRAIQDYENITDPAMYYETYYKQIYNYYTNTAGQTPAAANLSANQKMLNDLGYNIYTVPEGQLLIGQNGKLNPYATLGRTYQANGETYYLTNDNWRDQAYHNALRQEYNVSVTAGSDRSSFYASAGYLNEDGVIDYSGYERYTGRLKADYQAKEWLKVGMNVGYSHSKTTSNPNMSTEWGSTNLMYYTSMCAPIYPIYVRVIDPNTGQPVIRTDQYGHEQYDYGVAASNYPGNNRAFLQTGNPFGSNRYNEVYSLGNQLNGNATVDITFAPWLKFNATSTVIWGQTNQSDYQNSYYGPKTGVNGQITKTSSTALRTNNVQTLTFVKDFNDHSVTVMAGHEYYRTETKYLAASKTGGFSPDVPEINAFATMNDMSSYTTNYNIEGWFGNAQYNYKEKYYGSASFRRDASSYFPKEHRWGNFWSVGGAWIISKEAFMQSTEDWLDMLKVKASIGQQGNDNTQSYAFVDTYSLSKATETTMSPSLRLKGNPDLTWETTTNFNAGIEFSLWKGRLTGSVDVYNKKVTDQLFWLSIPESAGTRGYYGNIGDIRNQGIEVELTGAIVRTRDFDWSVSVNATRNKTKILSLPDSKIVAKNGFFESPYWMAEGGELNNYMTYEYAGVDPETGLALYYYDEDLSDLNPNNEQNTINIPGEKRSGTTTEIGHASRYTQGCILPKVYGGFSTTFRWKDIDVTATFDYQLGGKIYDSRYANMMSPSVDASDAGSNFHIDVLDAWSPTNPNSDIPRWQYGAEDQYAAAGSSRWLTNASYLNFQSFTVGYTLPKTFVKKFGVGNLRVYAAGENIGFLSARKGLDPRYSFSSTASTNVYSPVRNITGGVQVTF